MNALRIFNSLLALIAIIAIAFVNLRHTSSAAVFPDKPPQIMYIDLMGADGRPCRIEVGFPFGLGSIGKVQDTTCPRRVFPAKSTAQEQTP